MLFHPLVQDANMLQEEAMKLRLEDFQERYKAMAKREYSERFRFFQVRSVLSLDLTYHR